MSVLPSMILNEEKLSCPPFYSPQEPLSEGWKHGSRSSH